MACLEFRLSDRQLQRLNEVSKIDLGFPHDLLAQDLTRQSLFAEHLISLISAEGEGGHGEPG